MLWSWTSSATTLADEVVAFKLANGMRWLMVVRRQAPVFSGIVMIRVGGTDETEGKAGLAHMLEHMAFKGSKVLGTRDWEKEKPLLDAVTLKAKELSDAKNAPAPDKNRIAVLEAELKEQKVPHEKYYVKNEIWELMNKNGASDLNAFTSKDVTAYHASMPINRLELWMSVLSQMATDAVFREFYTERDVVAEERRSDVDNNPDGMLAESLLANSFQSGPYHWSTIGSLDEIRSFTLEDAKAFQEKYYVPGRMVGAIVGDIDIEKTKRFIEKYFGVMPARAVPPEPMVAENKGGGETRFAFDAQPSVALTFHKPTLPDPTEYVFDVATTLLCDGPTSRLYKKLVIEDKIAQRVSCTDAFPGSRLPNLLVIWVEPMNGTSLERATQAALNEIDFMKKELVSTREIERVRKKVTASFLFGLGENSSLAEELARFETIFNDWHLLIDYPDRVAAVTAEDVRQLAQKYFVPENRTIIMRVKDGAGRAVK